MTQRSIRAYRPSTCGFDSEALAEVQRAKELSIRLYTRLVEEGRIIFEDELDPPIPMEPEEQLVGV